MKEYQYLERFMDVVVLDTAIKEGVLDRLLLGPVPIAELGRNAGGSEILASLLVQSPYCRKKGDSLHLVDEFEAFVRIHRSRIEKHVSFLLMVAQDVLKNLPELLFDLPSFMANSETFSLFRYDRALSLTPENLESTRNWVEYVTALTESEAPDVVNAMDLNNSRAVLEIGGNSGAFALEMLNANPDLKVSVIDLPVVCHLGREYVEGDARADRLSFVEGDARKMNWRLAGPQQPDTVVFKSVLHDWPEEDAVAMVEKAYKALPASGKIYICERGQVQEAEKFPFSMVANLVFAPFYRQADTYVKLLMAKGFHDVCYETLNFEMPFNVITGTKP